MRRFDTHAGNLVRIGAADVTHADLGAVTTGLTGTVELYDSSDSLVLSDPITIQDGDDWYAEFVAPAAGWYAIRVELTYSGGERTLTGEMLVR